MFNCFSKFQDPHYSIENPPLIAPIHHSQDPVRFRAARLNTKFCLIPFACEIQGFLIIPDNPTPEEQSELG